MFITIFDQYLVLSLLRDVRGKISGLNVLWPMYRTVRYIHVDVLSCETMYSDCAVHALLNRTCYCIADFFYRAMRMHSADYAVSRCLSVCLSVRYTAVFQTATHRSY